MKIKLLVLALCGMTAAQAQDQIYDARSLAMGGVGVAISNTRNAAFLNPSALAAGEDKFALEFPIFSVRVLDEKDLMSDSDDLQTNADNLTNALNNFNISQTPVNANTAATALNRFNGSLNKVSGKSLAGGGFAGTMLAIPSKNYALALMLDARAELAAQFKYAPTDSSIVAALADDLSACAAGNNTNCGEALTSISTDGQVNGLQSKLMARGFVATDVGITVAHRFDIMGETDIGITPKFTKLRTFDVESTAQSNNGISTDNGTNNERSESVFNFDIGASRVVQKTDEYEIKAGLVVKDIISHSVKTVLNNNIDIKPKMTAGVGYMTKLISAGVDLDLVSNKPMIAGYGSESQFLRLGAEFDAWKWAQVRLGYRHDLKGNFKGLPSIGFGLSPYGVHFDLSIAAASKNERAVAMQFGLNF